jgi:cytochrome c-type biogenesis protein
MLDTANFPIAFLSGVLGFLSPCVLPLIPGYVAFVSGVSLQDMQQGRRARLGRVILGSALFVAGFSVVFTLLGASASLAGSLVLEHRAAISRAGGAIVILLGLAMLGWIKIPALYRERRIHVHENRWGLVGALPVGMAFGFAWTPCVGPVLGTILTMAASTESVDRGAQLLFAYSLGLGLPFLAAAAALTSAMGTLRWLMRHGRRIELLSATLLILVGLAMVTDQMLRFNAWLFSVFPFQPRL